MCCNTARTSASLLSAFLAGLLIFDTGIPLRAEQNDSSAALRIIVLSGEGAINNIRSRSNPAPLVEVRDANNQSVSGAAITFFLPNDGPSGVFADNTRTSIAFTDAQGRAAGGPIIFNSQVGLMRIRVSASLFSQTASVVITETNLTAEAMKAKEPAPPPPKSPGISKKKLILILVIAAAAAGGTYFALKHSSSNSATTITPGTPTVGGPN